MTSWRSVSASIRSDLISVFGTRATLDWRTYRNKCEFIAVFKVGEAAYFNAVQLGKHGRSRTTVWDSASVNTFGSARRLDLELHPTVKPTGLVADAIMDVTRRGDVVFDGSSGFGNCAVGM